MSGKETSKLIYLYGFLPCPQIGKHFEQSFLGIDCKNYLNLQRCGEIAALYSWVEEADFNKQELERRFKDSNWLQDKANLHYQIQNAIRKKFTFLPASFCTIFSSKERLKVEMSLHGAKIKELFHELLEKEEWNLKIYSNEDKFKSFILTSSPAVLNMQKEIENLPKGRQFFAKKTFQRSVETIIEEEKIKKWNELLRQLEPFFSKYKIKENWPKKVTQKSADMIFNLVFLITKEKTQAFTSTLKAYDKECSLFGWKIEYSGPWPFYNFADLAN